MKADLRGEAEALSSRRSLPRLVQRNHRTSCDLALSGPRNVPRNDKVKTISNGTFYFNIFCYPVHVFNLPARVK